MRDVNQLMNTWLKAKLSPTPTTPVLFLRHGTKLQTPGLAKGLGRNVLNLIDRGENIVHRF